MARKQFYLVRRRDKLTGGKPTFYCRFRDEATGGLQPWRSTGETSKTRAENWAQAEVRRERESTPGADITLAQFAADFFVPDRCSYLKRQAAKGRAVSEAWAQAKRQMLVNHVFPALGKCRLDALTRPMIERFLVDLDRSCQTRNHMLYTLKTVLAEAEAEGLIARNPLEHAEPLGKRQARKRDVFSLEELAALFPQSRAGLLAVWGTRKYAALFMTMATTGIREGEARALQWRHVLPEGWLVIERAVKEGGAVGAPKNGETRVAALPERTQRVIEWWRAESPYTQADDLVFHGDGCDHPLNRRTFQDVLSRALDGSDAEDSKTRVARADRWLTPHSFRHTYNTMMRRVLPAETLRALVGHRDERMTAHYDHPRIADLVKSLEDSRGAIAKALTW